LADAAWVALSLIRGVGGVTMRALLDRFGDVDAVLAASKPDLCDVRGVGQKTAQAMHAIDRHQMQRRIDRWQAAGVTVLPMTDATYPTRLKTVPDCPPTLFTMGTVKALDAPHIAIVGTRTPSDQARHQAATAGKVLAQAGAVVISGMAVGVDSIAQVAALEVPHSYNVAVLGSGVLKPYPQEHEPLAHMLRLYGLLACEVAPDAIVSTPGLVARNRVITGLADAVLIVETADDGGAMHAARAAVRQGRALFTIDSPASGNQQLIRDGLATPIAPDLGSLPQLLAGGG